MADVKVVRQPVGLLVLETAIVRVVVVKDVRGVQIRVLVGAMKPVVADVQINAKLVVMVTVRENVTIHVLDNAHVNVKVSVQEVVLVDVIQLVIMNVRVVKIDVRVHVRMHVKMSVLLPAQDSVRVVVQRGVWELVKQFVPILVPVPVRDVEIQQHKEFYELY